MQATREEPFHFRRTDVWREGKWIDLWSVVHTLSGISTGLVLYALHFGLVESFVIAFILFVAYELWEAMVKIIETPSNRFMDVVIGMVSFAPTFMLFAPEFKGSLFWAVFALIFIMNVVLATLGWIASRKAAVLEQHMRERYERGKARIRARAEQLRNLRKG